MKITPRDRLAAIRAGRFAIEAHQERRGYTQLEVQDCLTDIFHWAEAHGLDVENLTKWALQGWKQERHDP